MPSFKRLKRSYHGRGKGSLFPLSDKPALTLREALSQHSWKQRPFYYMEKKKAHVGVFKDGQVVEGQAVDVKNGSMKAGYSTGHVDMDRQMYGTATELSPSKVLQRTEVAEKAGGGTFLETYAGKGNLTNAVYAKEADKVVLLDKSKEALQSADKKLAGKVKRELVVADNVDWLQNYLPKEKLGNLRLVDFDAFGTPSAPVRQFFKSFKVRRKMYVTLTDGSLIYVAFRKGNAARGWIKKNYGVDLAGGRNREDQVKLLDTFMKVLGQHHGFTVTPVNAGFGTKHAVYAGYELTPK